eukprot:2054154-Pyramimonas_sp.AAC.1
MGAEAERAAPDGFAPSGAPPPPRGGGPPTGHRRRRGQGGGGGGGVEPRPAGAAAMARGEGALSGALRGLRTAGHVGE